jgi:ABC-type polysaccharide/polyol phosphate transport system ATPase subunit
MFFNTLLEGDGSLMSDTVIRLSHVSKRFKLYDNVVLDPVKENVFFWKKKAFYRDFWAVRDVSVEISKGEVVGIIGHNGAGKTTLLKIIANLLACEKGRIEVKGKVTALLSLGIGFHPEFSGRENIYYGGMLMGMSRREVLEKMADIIEFSELGDFMDRPLRTYSAGMKARLAFATSMSVDPDILIVDEALATGDTYFVSKSSKRIREICKSGATILFVSHNLQQVQDICKRVLFMADGSIVDDGEPSRVVNAYQRWVFKKNEKEVHLLETPELRMVKGTGDVQLRRIRLMGQDEVERKGFHTNEAMVVALDYVRVNSEVKEVNLFIGVHLESTGEWVAEFTNFQEVEYKGLPRERAAIKIDDHGTILVIFDPCLLLTNRYVLQVIISSRSRENLIHYCAYRGICPFFVGKPSDPIGVGPVYKMPGVVRSISS